VPFVDLSASPLAPGASPVRIHYRDCGAGRPLVLLHSGWGYEVYPFDRQIAALQSRYRIIAPDRSGYGASPPIASLPVDFHARAASETLAVIEALELDRPVVWGHSDGAIIALLLALDRPDAVAAVIAEATHFFRRKPHSRAFFETMATNAGAALGFSMASVLARDHGERWPEAIARHSQAWLRIGDEAASDCEDFYGGRLRAIEAPVLVVHGQRDPRTEPGEIDALHEALLGFPRRNRVPHAVDVLAAGGHSPHSEPATSEMVTASVEAFLRS